MRLGSSSPLPSEERARLVRRAKLLAWGGNAWHLVDFALLDDATHAKLNTLLGGTTWCYDSGLLLQHNQYGCERFASTLAWASWPSPDNCMKPSQIDGESGAITPAAFRSLHRRSRRQLLFNSCSR